MNPAVSELWASRMLSILRIITALLFIEHGTQKLFGFPPSANPGPSLFSLLGFQGVLEVVGGLLLVFGFLTRPVAFILAGDMAVAYFMAHAPRSFFPALNGGDSAILYCFVFLYLAVAGGGEWSIDAVRNPKLARALSGRTTTGGVSDV
jgi:putative oxidoreductase